MARGLVIPSCTQCKVVQNTLEATIFYQLLRALGTCDPLHSEPIIPRIQHAACHVRWFDTIVQEGIGQKLCVECGVIRWAIKDKVSNASNFVSARGGLVQKLCGFLLSKRRTFDRSGNAQ